VFFSRSTRRAPRLLKKEFPLGIFCVLDADDTKFVFDAPPTLPTSTADTITANAKPNDPIDMAGSNEI
jgi:hypothetical protein